MRPSERRQAEEWKREKRSQLEAQIRIEMAVLRSLRTELAGLNTLDGSRLLDRYLCESPAEVQDLFRGKREYIETLEEIWIEGEYSLKPAC